MRIMRNPLTAGAAALLLVGAASAGTTVTVTATGEVEYNQVRNGPLSAVHSGDAVTMSFTLDSDNFQNSPFYPTRGYVIDQPSFTLTLGSVGVALQNPFPVGTTPYFVLRDNDPAVDGFFVADNTDWPTGLPTNEPGAFGQFINNYSVGYDGSTLSSLDILGALGTYDYTNLTNFNWTIDDDGFSPIGILFTQMTIVPEPATLALAVPLALLAWRRRR